jgi:hypothetical protein
LFSSTAPAPEFAAETPATQPAALAPIFAMGFGSPDLVTNTYRLAYLRDAQAAPDGGFPTVTTGIPAAAPTNTLRQELKTNDLRNWAPTAPVLLCAGDEDPTAFYLNTRLMQNYWTATTSAAVTVLDVDSAVTALGPLCRFRKKDSSRPKQVTQTPSGGGDDGWRRYGRARGVSCPTRSACLPECGKILFRRILMRVKWQLSLTSC